MDPKNILVRMPNWVGDLVMAIPVLLDLREKFPEASITAMALSPLSDLLQKESAIDELFSFQRLENEFLRREEKRSIIRKIEGGKYDVGILLTNSFSSAWWFWQGKVKRRIGYAGNFRSFFLTDAMTFPKKKMHQVDLYKHLLKPLGIKPSETMPRIILEKKEEAAAETLLVQRGYQKGAHFVAINPGAAFGSAKCWPPERFRKLTEELLAQTDRFIVFLGASAQGELIKEISRGLPERVLNLAGVTSLRELAALIKKADLVITNDSGPMHIAAALDRPLIALFGSTDASVTGPFGKQEAVIDKKVSCSPCLKRECPIDFRCMKEISVEEVVQKALSMLRLCSAR